MIEKEEFIQWKSSIVTKMLFEQIKDTQEKLKDFVIFGGTQGENSVANTARAVGRAEALQDILEWNPIEESEDES